MDTNFWVICTSSGMFRVDEETWKEFRVKMRSIAGLPHQNNTEIEFTDIAGSQIVVYAGAVHCTIESTVEQRALDRRINEALDEESKKQPWED